MQGKQAGKIANLTGAVDTDDDDDDDYDHNHDDV